MSQAALNETQEPKGDGSEIDAFRERVRELREKLERANAATPNIPAPSTPAPVRAPAPAPAPSGLPAAIEQKMLEATQRIEALAAREQDLTSLLRRTRDELEASERAQEQAADDLRLAEERVRAAIGDGDQAVAVAEGLRQQVDAQRKRIEALATENSALQDRTERLNAEMQQAARSEAAARDDLHRLQSTFDALQESYDAVRRQKGDLERSLTRTSNRINEFETELMSQLQHLETEYARIEGESNDNEARATEAEAERVRLADELDSRDAEIASLREAYAAGEAKRSEEAEKRRAIDVRLESLQDELSGLQSRYAADLVELDAARQNAARFEKRAGDLTDELQAYRKMQEQHEAAFAQMDSLFRSLDAKKAAEDAADEPAPAPAAVAPTPIVPEPVAPKAAEPAAPSVAPAPVEPKPAAATATQPVEPAAPKAIEPAAAPRNEPAPAAPAAPAKVSAKPASPIVPAEDDLPAAATMPLMPIKQAAPSATREDAANNARERLGKSLEALQALAAKRRNAEAGKASAPAATTAKPDGTASAAPVAMQLSPEESGAVETAEVARPVRRVKVTPIKKAAKTGPVEAKASPEPAPKAEPAPVQPAPVQPAVEAPAPAAETRQQVEAPATDAEPDRMAGFIMPKPRLLSR